MADEEQTARAAHAARIAVIGAGPAGLMAAEVIARAGYQVTVYDRMPSPARKFLMAGRGGLNLTHSEPLGDFLGRYGMAQSWLAPAIADFPPGALRQWSAALGQPTFIGSSGRVFPETLKASPLLRAWLARLSEQGVRFAFRHDWQGWAQDGILRFAVNGAAQEAQADAVLLALGGASWPRLGSDGNWARLLAARGVELAPFAPSNCGFRIAWSDRFRSRFAGAPVKSAGFGFAGQSLQGEAVITADGIEGGAIYALSARLRDAIAAEGHALLEIDLRPGLSQQTLAQRLAGGGAAQSLSNILRKAAGLPPVAMGLLHEAAIARKGSPALPRSPEALAAMIKSVTLELIAPGSLARAISSAGGVKKGACDSRFMLKKLPGVFVAGEMLDFEAPTGGYLLQASFSTGCLAARGLLDWIASRAA